jgi:molecular chaperone DnaK
MSTANNSPAALGISIGNATTRAVIFAAGQSVLLPLEEGETTMPSAILLHRCREVGKYAYWYSGTEPHLLVTSINRLLGRKYGELQPELAQALFSTRDENGCLRVISGENIAYSAIELYAMLLRKVAQAAKRYWVGEIGIVVIAVPGSFDDFQRRSIQRAAQAVFSNVVLVSEPLAAGLMLATTNSGLLGPAQNGVKRLFRRTAAQRFLTCDIGAGKCEVAVIQCQNKHLRIESITGDTHLGGNDIDQILVTELARRFTATHQHSIAVDPQTAAMVRHELLIAARAAKHELAQQTTTSINIPFVDFDRYGRPLHLTTQLTQPALQQLCQPLQQRIRAILQRSRQDTRPWPNQALLLGGTTHLPLIQNLVREQVAEILPIANPAEITVYGACHYGAQLLGLVPTIWRVTDVTAHSLGITTYDGSMGVVLSRQSTIPARTARRFYTVAANQQEVHIEVREGENSQAQYNRQIGAFSLPLPANLPRHTPIDVTIGKNADGIVFVQAQHSSGQLREITITYDL